MNFPAPEKWGRIVLIQRPDNSFTQFPKNAWVLHYWNTFECSIDKSKVLPLPRHEFRGNRGSETMFTPYQIEDMIMANTPKEARKLAVEWAKSKGIDIDYVVSEKGGAFFGYYVQEVIEWALGDYVVYHHGCMNWTIFEETKAA